MSRYAIHGYAIVSSDDRIADASGAMPAQLKNDADYAYFQAGLDLADFVVLGRASHEAAPNRNGRRRIVMSRALAAFERRADALWWNPQGLAFGELMADLAPEGARVAVPGGQAAFDLFLGIGYSAFHLSLASDVRLPGGRGLFSVCDRGVSAAAALTEAGMVADPPIVIDKAVTLTIWQAPEAHAAATG